MRSEKMSLELIKKNKRYQILSQTSGHLETS